MKFSAAVDEYVRDMRAQGRMRSAGTERSYRSILARHLEDVGNRDPRYVGRSDVKRTLYRWDHPNTQNTARSILVSFYKWMVREGYRKDNPAEQTQPARRQPSEVYRMTRGEAAAMLLAAYSQRERWAVYLGICAGLRNAELRGLQGRHLARPGFVWVSADIGKGGRERWVPVIVDLAQVVAEIRFNVSPEEYVLPAQRFRDPPFNTQRDSLRFRPSSSQALNRLVKGVGERAGIGAPIYPHLMRHAYGDHIARHAGVRNAQFMLGHADIATTETYLGRPTLDELAGSIEGFTFGTVDRTDVLGGQEAPSKPNKATTGIEPVYTALQAAA